MFLCIKCGRKHGRFSVECECGNLYSVLEVPDFHIEEVKNNSRVRNINDLLEEELDCEPVPGFEFLGDVSEKYSMIVYGSPGSGKSTFCMMLCNAYMKYRRSKILYVSGEESFSTTFRKKLKDWDVKSSLFWASESVKIEHIIEDINEYSPHLVVLDSHTSLNLSWDEVDRIIKSIPGPTIVILHVTKDNKYKGDTMIAHHTDINIEIDEETGNAITRKTRFGEKYTTFSIFGNAVKELCKPDKEIIRI